MKPAPPVTKARMRSRLREDDALPPEPMEVQVEHGIDEAGEQPPLAVVAALRELAHERLGAGLVDEELVQGVERKAPSPAPKDAEALALQRVLHGSVRKVTDVAHVSIDGKQRGGG